MLGPCLKRGQLEELAKRLGEEVTGSILTLMLEQVHLKDQIELSTKWKRIYNAFVYYQNEKGCSNQIMNFIKLVMEPSRYIGKSEQYQAVLNDVSAILSFVGYEIRDDGKIYSCNLSEKLSDAEQRANNLKKKLEYRSVHQQIFKYCTPELLANNYFHAVFEANKGLFQRLRNSSGLSSDGISLIEQIFSNNPILIINNYITQSEKDEHRGFCNILKGLCGMFRNTEAHEPKYSWEISEQDALEILGLISYCHRRLDNAQKIKMT